MTASIERPVSLGDSPRTAQGAVKAGVGQAPLSMFECSSLQPSAVIATNTSSISITRLAAVTDRPGQFIGIHFMNPVPIMQLVALIRGRDPERPLRISTSQLKRPFCHLSIRSGQAAYGRKRTGGFRCLTGQKQTFAAPRPNRLV